MAELRQVSEIVGQPGPLGGQDLWLLAAVHPDGVGWLRRQAWAAVMSLALATGASPGEVLESMGADAPTGEVWETGQRAELEVELADLIHAELAPGLRRAAEAEPVDADEEAMNDVRDSMLLLSEVGLSETLEDYVMAALIPLARATGLSPRAVLDGIREGLPSDDAWVAEELPALDECVRVLIAEQADPGRERELIAGGLLRSEG